MHRLIQIPEILAFVFVPHDLCGDIASKRTKLTKVEQVMGNISLCDAQPTDSNRLIHHRPA